jgi:N-acylneuraminate cytidylyltransferase/CMP-N,N'-diacetyllegionaminic acid synthase
MLAIIPARGGSKGISNKNIKSFDNEPLIAYTIKAAKKSKFISKIVCSTDSKEISKVAIEYGAEVPFLRPKELAKDDSKAIDNYLYSIPKYNEYYNYEYENFVVLQPTSPLRTAEDIDKAISLFNSKKADSVISFSEMTHPPSWAKTIDENLHVKDYFTNPYHGRNRQEIPQGYIPNGAIFVFNYYKLKELKKYYTDKTYAYIMPLERAIDIDTKIDFEFAEFLMRRMKKY